MLEHAQSLDATELARLGRHLAHVVDPDATDRKLEAQLDREDRAAHAGRFLAITEDRAGGVRIKGYGSTEDAALLKAALLPLTCPTPAVDDEDGSGEPSRDPRDHGARLWDALIATARHALTTAPAAGDPRHPTPAPGHPRPPHLLKAALASRGIGTTEDGAELSPATRAQVGLRRRDHPRRPRRPRRGPRHRPHPTPGHRRPLDRPGPPGPALHLPRLHPTPGDVPRPPPHPLGRRRRTPRSTTSPCSAATTTGSSTTRPGRSGSTHMTNDPNSGHHPNPVSHPHGSDKDTDWNNGGTKRRRGHPGWSTPTDAELRAPTTARSGEPGTCSGRRIGARTVTITRCDVGSTETSTLRPGYRVNAPTLCR